MRLSALFCSVAQRVKKLLKEEEILKLPISGKLLLS